MIGLITEIHMRSFAVTAGESLTRPPYLVDVVLDTFFCFRASRTFTPLTTTALPELFYAL